MKAREIVVVLEALGADYVSTGHGNVSCCCLLAQWRHSKGTDNSPSMGVKINNEGTSLVHCFACHFSGTIEGLVGALRRHDGTRCDYSKVTAYIREAEFRDIEERVKNLPAYNSVPTAPVVTAPLPVEAARKYLTRIPSYVMARGIRKEVAKRWGIGFDPDNSRVFLPILDHQGKLVGATGRYLLPPAPPLFPRYRDYWSKLWSRREWLFGEQFVRGSHLVVVEGPFDTIRVWQALLDGGLLDVWSVVGLFGTKPTPQQLDKVVAYATEVVLFFDGDDSIEAWKNYRKVYDRLRTRVRAHAPHWPTGYFAEGRDPSELTDTEILTALNEARPLV